MTIESTDGSILYLSMGYRSIHLCYERRQVQFKETNVRHMWTTAAHTCYYYIEGDLGQLKERLDVLLEILYTFPLPTDRVDQYQQSSL